MIGAGVAGLTTAVCLAESGLAVTVRARQLPQQTTSAVAGAIWGRHLVEDSDRVTRWCAETLEVLTALAADPGTGVRLVTGIDAARAAYPHPGWAAPLGDLRPMRPGGPAGGLHGGLAVHRAGGVHARLPRLPGPPAASRRRAADRRAAGLAGRGCRAGHRAGDRELHRGRGPRLRPRPVGDRGPRPGRGGREPGRHRVLHRGRGRDPRAQLRVPAPGPGGAGRDREPGRLVTGPPARDRAADPGRLRGYRPAARHRPDPGAPGGPAPGPARGTAGGRDGRPRC